MRAPLRPEAREGAGLWRVRSLMMGGERPGVAAGTGGGGRSLRAGGGWWI